MLYYDQMSKLDQLTHPAWEPPRFFTPKTIAGVMKAKLELTRQPFEINPFSPTPLDPYRLKIKDGLLYDDSARLYMEHMQRDPMAMFNDEEEDPAAYRRRVDAWIERRQEELLDAPNARTWESVSREIQVQHRLKEYRNDTALALLQQDQRTVSPAEAEELMQVRAGVAPLPTMMRVLARYPELGGLELMKATRPFDPRAIMMARIAFMKALGSIEESDMSVVLESTNMRRLVIVPDKEFHDEPDPRIIVQKTNIAKVALELDQQVSTLEVVWRDSGVILDPAHDDLSKTYSVWKDDDGVVVAHVAPIAVTAYARLAPRQETA